MCINMQEVCMLEHTYLAFVMFAAPWMVDLLRKSMHQNCKLGTMIDGNLELSLPASLPLADSGIGVILYDLAGVISRSVVEVEALTSSAASDFSGEGVTPAMGTWGGASVVDALTASIMDGLEGTEGHT